MVVLSRFEHDEDVKIWQWIVKIYDFCVKITYFIAIWAVDEINWIHEFSLFSLIVVKCKGNVDFERANMKEKDNLFGHTSAFRRKETAQIHN